MAIENEPGRSRLSIEVEPELRQRIEAAAAVRGMSVRDFVVATLRRAVDGRPGEEPTAADTAWSRLSARSFARDWESDADAVYDDLA